MSQPITMEIVDSGLELAVLSIIASMTEPTYAINIHNQLLAQGHHRVALDEVYDPIIDLIVKERITVRETNPGKSQSRRIYELVIPEHMERWGPTHGDYPNTPTNWDKGQVLHLDGSLSPTHGTTNELAWFHDGHQDGTDIIAYVKE